MNSARGEIYLEFISVGRQVKVVAIDAATGIEVSIFGPLTASQAELQRIAVAKLKRRIAMEKPGPASRGN